MHIFHKWETIRKEVVTGGFESALFGKNWEEQIVVVLQECKCGKKRAFGKKANGDSFKIDEDYLEHEMRKL
jgi:hypothetical protein